MYTKISSTPRQSKIKTRVTKRRNQSTTSTVDHLLKAPFLNTDNEKKMKGKNKINDKKIDTNHISKGIKIHQEGLSDIDILLRNFDLNYKYGPCVGMSRLDRWERAQFLELDPPMIIKDILINSNNGYQQSLFYEANILII